MKPHSRHIITLLIVLMISNAGCVENNGTSEQVSMQNVEAEPRLNDTWTRPADGMEMVYVPAGTLQMGSSDGEVDFALSLCEQYPDAYGKCTSENFQAEAPQHSVG